MLNLDELLPDVFALDCDFPGINIDPVSMDASLADLQLDLKEDIYELQFHNTSMFRMASIQLSLIMCRAYQLH